MRSASRILLVLLVVVGVIAIPSSAQAAAAFGVGYKSAGAWTCAGSGSGHRDVAGVMYQSCGGKVRVTAANGSYTNVAVTGAKSFYSVAPSPDGRLLYTITYSYNNAAGLGMTLQRLRRAATSYVLDTTFQPRKFKYAGAWHNVCGRDVATDAYGYIYVSQGGWCANLVSGVRRPVPTLIIKYAPDGTIVTQFGDSGKVTARSEAAGLFDVNNGIDVTPDGRRIYVADHLNVRIQYFDWQLTGGYKYAGSIKTVTYNGAKIPFSATYDVKLDRWGNIYVADTTRAIIWKLSPTGEVISKVIDLDGGRLHVFSVDARGWVYPYEAQIAVGRTATNPPPTTVPVTGPEPKADLLPPVLRAATPAAVETTESSVVINIDATDDAGVTKMRTAGTDGVWGEWQPYTSSLVLPLPSLGWNELYVQVGDVLDHRSAPLHVKVLRRPVPDTTAPTLRVETAAATATRQIMLSINSADAIGVTHLRIAGDDGTYGDWLPWSAGARMLAYELGEAYRTYVVSVQVRDAAFNVADAVSLKVAFMRPSAPTAPGGTVGGGDTTLVVPQVIVRDLVAPRVIRLIAPRVTCSRIVMLRISARDDASRVRFVRVANEDGRFGRWQTYRYSLRHKLTLGATRKFVTVQVRDAAGNISTGRSARVLVRRCR